LEEGAKSTEDDKVIEERISIHQSNNSSKLNALKYTKVMKDGRRLITRNYSEALKVHNRFAGVFIRRAGDVSHNRYAVSPTKGETFSLGKYDPDHFQPVFFVLVGPADRKFGIALPESKNVTQVPFKKFSLVVIWQFLAFTGQTSTRSLMLRTFSEEEIASAPTSQRADMLKMQHGFSEVEALETFDSLKSDLALSLLRTTWNILTEEEKREFAPLMLAMMEFDSYVKKGRSFSRHHRELLLLLGKVADFHRARLNGRIPAIDELPNPLLDHPLSFPTA
jgi:hypothetical protein